MTKVSTSFFDSEHSDKNTRSNWNNLYPKPENFARLEQINYKFKEIEEKQLETSKNLQSVSETLSRLADFDIESRTNDFLERYEAVQSELVREDRENNEAWIRYKRDNPPISEENLAKLSRRLSYKTLVIEQTFP
jgi:hypothetical protein